MSADNGVYILVTRGLKRGRKEYRVAEAWAIENIDWQPDHPVAGPHQHQLNREEVLKRFGEARVLTDRKIAEGYAQRIYDEVMEDFGVVKYGICFLDHANIRFPRKHRPRRRVRRLASVA